MHIDPLLTDDAVLAELGSRIERARLERNLTQRRLAEDASVSVSTLRRLEAGGGATVTNLVRVLRALELLEGLEQLVLEPVPSPIQQLRLAGRRRRRASGRRARERRPRGEGGTWVWADEAER